MPAWDAVTVVSHQRSGTHWTIDSLRNNVPGTDDRYRMLDKLQDATDPERTPEELLAYLDDGHGRAIFKTHGLPDLPGFPDHHRDAAREILDRSRIVYVVRDPRDVMVSLFHHLAYSRDRMPDFPAFLRQTNDIHPTERDRSRPAYWAHHVRSWLQASDHDPVVVAFEQLHADYEATLLRFTADLGLDVDPAAIEPVPLRDPNIFRRVLGRHVSRGFTRSTAVGPRKGETGDWQELFGEDDLRYLRDEAGDALDLVTSLDPAGDGADRPPAGGIVEVDDDYPWPNLFIVGAEKAGTTSLWDDLRRHPRIFFPSRKEPGFFAKGWDAADDPDGHRRHWAGPVPDDHGSLESAQAAYLRYYRGALRPVRGDASAGSLWHPRAAERIADRVDEPRIVVLLREPVERAFSHYLMARRNGAEERSFPEAIEADLERETRGDPPRRYVLSSRYAEALERYVAAVGRERIHVAFTETMADDPKAVLDGIVSFLGLDPAPLADEAVGGVRNPYRRPPNELARWLRTDETVRRIARSVFPDRVRDAIGNRLLLADAEKPSIDPAAEARLVELLDPDVRRLRELIDRDPPWPRFADA